jgi:hypothetical protein
MGGDSVLATDAGRVAPEQHRGRQLPGTAALLGPRGCAGRMAQEFGDHPRAAAERMRWVRELITVPLLCRETSGTLAHG